MSGYEAKAYVALVAAGAPLNGYEVAKRSGVPRSTVYETLAKLVGRGAAYEVRAGEDNVGYISLPPTALLDRLRREFDQSMDTLRDALPEIASPPQVRLVHSLSDRASLLARAEDVIAAARSDIFLSGFPAELDPLKPAARRAEADGVEISVVTFGEDKDPVGNTTPHRFSAPEVVLENLGCRLLVVSGDREQAVIGGVDQRRRLGCLHRRPRRGARGGRVRPPRHRHAPDRRALRPRRVRVVLDRQPPPPSAPRRSRRPRRPAQARGRCGRRPAAPADPARSAHLTRRTWRLPVSAASRGHVGYSSGRRSGPPGWAFLKSSRGEGAACSTKVPWPRSWPPSAPSSARTSSRWRRRSTRADDIPRAAAQGGQGARSLRLRHPGGARRPGPVDVRRVAAGDGARLHDPGAALAVRHQQRHRRPHADGRRHPGAEGASGCRKLASGDVVASFALTEAEAGSDPSGLTTSARRDGDDWVINGSKRFITNAPSADVFMVYARTDPDAQPARGISTFLVPRDAAGLTVGPKDHKMGQFGAWTADVYLDDVRVPHANLIGGDAGPAPRLPHRDAEPRPRSRPHRRDVCRHVRAAGRRDRELRRHPRAGRSGHRRATS